jgi:MFS family permease
MAQDSVVPGSAQFSVGRVMGDSFKVLARNFIPFMVLSIVCAVPNFVVTALNPGVQRLLNGDLGTGAPIEPFSTDRVVLTLVGWLVSILCYALNQSALVYGTVQDLQGRRVGLGAIVVRGFASVLPVIGVAILMTLGLMVGFLLIIIPGFILLTMWWVAVPAIVIERTSVTDAFGRSRELTAGRRWPIFGLFVLYAVIQQIVSWIVAAVVGGIIGATSGNMVGAFGGGVISAMLVGIVFAAWFAVMTAVGYYYLRADKEGIVIDDIARVFD